MSQGHTEKLENWWAQLPSEEQVALVQVEEGEPVPSEHAASITQALSVDPAAVETDTAGEDVTVYADERLARFLAEKRESFGGYTV
jgi:hypothetical protein